MKRPWRLAAGVLCALAASAFGPARAQVLFEIGIDDPAGLFTAHHADLQRLAMSAGQDWAAHFETPAGPAVLTVRIGFDAIPTATGRSLSSGFLHTDGFGLSVYEQGAAYELRTGVDPNAGAPDIEIIFGSNGYLQNELWFDPQPGQPAPTVPSDRTDAYSVLLHEFGHAFGFNGWRDPYTGALPADYLSSFDALVEWRPSTGGMQPFFTGATAAGVFGGAVPLTLGRYGHLGSFDGADGGVLAQDLMNGLSFERGARYGISALNLAMLRDLGLPLAAAVPEPAPALLLLLGLAGLAAWRRRSSALVAAGLLVAGCGGGSSSTPAAVDEAQRVAAASATATSHPKCSAATIGSFYWEIGDGNGVRASGSVGTDAPGPGTRMALFSSSKWVYAAYVAQKRGLRDADAPYLNFTSGHVLFGPPFCPGAPDVQSCGQSDGQDPAMQGRFYYDSGHMQYHARAVMGLGAADNAALGAEIAATLGDFAFVYTQPQMAAGIEGTPQGYAAFLRRIVRGELAIAAGLGSHQVPATYDNAAHSPETGSERWDYALGHWVEIDPAVGDGTFSSAGGGGFYPWIDASRALYGLLARERFTESHAAYHSAECGRLIRRAWVSGQQVAF